MHCFARTVKLRMSSGVAVSGIFGGTPNRQNVSFVTAGDQQNRKYGTALQKHTPVPRSTKQEVLPG